MQFYNPIKCSRPTYFKLDSQQHAHFNKKFMHWGKLTYLSYLPILF